MSAAPADHVSDAGHIQIYFDSVDTAPITITAEVKVAVRDGKTTE